MRMITLREGPHSGLRIAKVPGRQRYFISIYRKDRCVGTATYDSFGWHLSTRYFKRPEREDDLVQVDREARERDRAAAVGLSDLDPLSEPMNL